MAHNKKLLFIYENKDESETAFVLAGPAEEHREREQAERELHSRDTSINGYRTRWEKTSHLPGESFEYKK